MFINIISLKKNFRQTTSTNVFSQTINDQHKSTPYSRRQLRRDTTTKIIKLMQRKDNIGTRALRNGTGRVSSSMRMQSHTNTCTCSLGFPMEPRRGGWLGARQARISDKKETGGTSSRRQWSLIAPVSRQVACSWRGWSGVTSRQSVKWNWIGSSPLHLVPA